MSVPDYTSARWAEMAGVDVAVVGDSLAMAAHGHPTRFRRGWTSWCCTAGGPPRRAPDLLARLHALSELQHGRSRAPMPRASCRSVVRCGQAAGREERGAYLKAMVDAGIPIASRIGPTPTPSRCPAASRFRAAPPRPRSRSRGCAGDRGCRLLHARVRGGPGEDRRGDLEAAHNPRSLGAGAGSEVRSCRATTCPACSPTSSRNSPSATPTSPRSRWAASSSTSTR